MFSGMVHELVSGRKPESGLLEKRFDAAMTKKLGIVKLPPAFWMRDPKINPRADHLFWASLLIGDRQRVDLAISVIAAELEVNSRGKKINLQRELVSTVQVLVGNLLDTMSDTVLRRELEYGIHGILPEFFPDNLEITR